MTKNEFLEKLAQKLKILNKDEVADIINEYAGYIDNKIAEGKSEEEAVADFGDMTDLVKEILSAYKLSEDYISSDDDFSNSKFFADAADVFNKSIDHMTRFFKDTCNRTDANRIVTVLVTLFVALVIVAIVKIPFLVVEHLGRTFVHFIFPSFLSGPLSFFWILLVNIIYLIVVIVIVASLLKGGFGVNIDFIKNSIETAAKRKKENKEKNETNCHEHYSSGFEETPGSDKPASEAPGNDDNVSRKGSANNPFTFLLKVVLNIFAVILLIPLFPSVIGLGIAAGVCVYLLMQGISIYGLTLLAIGLFILFASFISLVISIIYKHGKKLKSHLASVLIASVMIGFGGVFTFFELVNYDYFNGAPETMAGTVSKNYIYGIGTDRIIINANDVIMYYVVDNTLNNGIMFDIRYNDIYTEVGVDSTIENQSGDNFYNNDENGREGSTQIITITRSLIPNRDGFVFRKEIIKNIIDGLKDKKIYTMATLKVPEVTVYANETFLRQVSRGYGNFPGRHFIILERIP